MSRYERRARISPTVRRPSRRGGPEPTPADLPQPNQARHRWPCDCSTMATAVLFDFKLQDCKPVLWRHSLPMETRSCGHEGLSSDHQGRDLMGC